MLTIHYGPIFSTDEDINYWKKKEFKIFPVIFERVHEEDSPLHETYKKITA